MRRSTFLLASLLVLGAAPPHPAPPRFSPPLPVPRDAVRLSPDSESRWVLFDLTPGNQVHFTLILDGAPVSAILDTGVSSSVLSRRFVDAKGSVIHPGERATVIGGSVPTGWVDTGSLALGGLSRAGGRLVVAELPALATGGASPIEMLVGRDLIGNVALDLDYANKRFRLLPSGRRPFAGAIAPLTISRHEQVYVSTLQLGRARLAPMIVDTGDGAAVTVSTPNWRAAGLSALPTTTTLAFGLVGPVPSTIAVVPVLRIGTLAARNVELRVEPEGGFSQSIGVAGRIGSGFLQRYRVLLDPRAGRMVLSPGPTADQVQPRSTSGLLAGLASDRLQVLHVMRGSPAEAAGWKAGDTICSVDGNAVGPDYIASGLAAWSIGAPGRVVRLGLCDGTTRLLTLRAFY